MALRHVIFVSSVFNSLSLVLRGNGTVPVGCYDLVFDSPSFRAVAPGNLEMLFDDVMPGINMRMTSSDYVPKKTDKTGESNGYIAVNMAPGAASEYTISFETADGFPFVPEPCVYIALADIDCLKNGCEEMTTETGLIGTWLAEDTVLEKSSIPHGVRFSNVGLGKSPNPTSGPLGEEAAKAAVQFAIGGQHSFTFKFSMPNRDRGGSFFLAGYGPVGDAPPPIPFPTTALTTTTTTTSTCASQKLYRYYNNEVVDHLYTSDFSELGTGKGGYTHVGHVARLWSTPCNGAVPLHRYLRLSGSDDPKMKDHFLSTSDELAAEENEYKFEGIVGYCSPEPVIGTVPFYRYILLGDGIVDHIYTTDAEEIGTTTAGETGKDNYKYEGVACYVLPRD